MESLKSLEAGGDLPPETHAREPEDGAAFVARIDKLIARYEAQFLKKSQQKVNLQRSSKKLDACLAWPPGFSNIVWHCSTEQEGLH